MIVLRLDRKALAEFIESQPEEFKFELSRAVLAEASRNLVRGIVPADVLEILQAGVDAEVAKQIGSVTGNWNKRKVKLNTEVKESIEGMVRDTAQTAVEDAYKLFKEALDEKAERYMQHAKKVTEDRFERIVWSKIRQEMHDEVERQMMLMLQQ